MAAERRIGAPSRQSSRAPRALLYLIASGRALAVLAAVSIQSVVASGGYARMAATMTGFGRLPSSQGLSWL
jgi:hypothetical protein